MRHKIIECDRCGRKFAQGSEAIAKVDARWVDDRGDVYASHSDLCSSCTEDFHAFMLNVPTQPNPYEATNGTEADND